MNCYQLVSSGVPTESTVGWTYEKNGPWVVSEPKGWSPFEDIYYQIGGNTWHAEGPLTQETLENLKDLWIGTGAEASLKNSHVLGELDTQPWIDAVVDQAFVDAMTQLDDRLFSFVEHKKVWDRVRNCPPWDGSFYIATLLPLRPSYDLTQSDLVPAEGLQPRFEGKYGSSGARRVVKASATHETMIWRDTYTRQVMVNDEGRAAIEALGIKEWTFWPRKVSDDT